MIFLPFDLLSKSCRVDPLKKIITDNSEPERSQSRTSNSIWTGLLSHVKIRRVLLCSFIVQYPIHIISILLELKSVMVSTLWTNLHDIKIRRNWKVAIFQLLFSRNWNHFFKAYIFGIVKSRLSWKEKTGYLTYLNLECSFTLWP